MTSHGGATACVRTCVRERERPESQVAGGVRDAAETVLDRVDALVHEHLAEVKLQNTQRRAVHVGTAQLHVHAHCTCSLRNQVPSQESINLIKYM